MHRLGVVTAMHGVWRAGFDAASQPTERANVEALARAGVPVEIATMTGTDFRANLVALVEREMETAAKRDVDSLPLVELPADRPSRVMAVLVSGDGGWRDLDKTIGEKLQALGVPVVGWDSLRYFWSRKTPEQTTADLTAILAAYGAKWRADKFALIGNRSAPTRCRWSTRSCQRPIAIRRRHDFPAGLGTQSRLGNSCRGLVRRSAQRGGDAVGAGIRQRFRANSSNVTTALKKETLAVSTLRTSGRN